MNVWPLIVRELRAEARRANTYWTRTAAAGFLTALLVWTVWSGGPATSGRALFGWIFDGLLIALLVIVSSSAGDAISREKREGTLGLLFLTPLTAWEIVLGKTLLHGLRAVTFFLATLPILALPFLLGGINDELLLRSLVFLVSALIIALATGMIASIHSTEWIQALVTSLLLCGAVWFGISLVTPYFSYGWIALPISAVLLALALSHAGYRLRTSWQTESSSAEPFWVKLFSSSDFWRAAFRWDTRKARDRNPIAWLQEYNWTSRLTKWGWCLILFAAQAQLLLQFRQYLDYQMQLYRLTALGIAFSAAASFRRERQTGALELLLVTPISPAQLLFGRLQGVWTHFLPPILILTTVWVMGPHLLSLPIRYAWYLAGAYFCIPIIGFYCSMIYSNVLVAWGMTILFALLIPHYITDGYRFEIGRRNIPFAYFIIQLTFATLSAWLLYDNLIRRRFALQR